jgi:hypothetical protein
MVKISSLEIQTLEIPELSESTQSEKPSTPFSIDDFPGVKDQVITRFKDDSVDRVAFTLEDACEISGYLIRDFLHAASAGKVNLVITLPDKLDVYLANNYLKYVGTPIPRPNLLILNREYCRKIYSQKLTKQSDFNMGYSIDLRNNIQKLPPQFYSSAPLGSGAVWRIGKEGTPIDVNITVDQLLITHLDLKAFIEQHGTKNSNDSTQLKPNEEDSQVSSIDTSSVNKVVANRSKYKFQLTRDKSAKFRVLARAMELYWEKADPLDICNHAAINEKVKKYLLNFGVSEKLANLGVRLIQPNFARKDFKFSGNPVEDNQYVTNEFKAMVLASKRFWDIDFAQSAIAPKNSKVSLWLQENHNFSKIYLADSAANFLRHEKAALGRPLNIEKSNPNGEQ